MTTAQQAALVDLAAAEGRALEGGLASPALVLAVKVCLPLLLTTDKPPHMFKTLSFARPLREVYLYVSLVGQQVPQTVLANSVQRFHACVQQLLARKHHSTLQGITYFHKVCQDKSLPIGCHACAKETKSLPAAAFPYQDVSSSSGKSAYLLLWHSV